MNKIIICFVMYLSGTIFVVGQEARYGIRLGVNSSSISSTFIENDLDKNRIGLVVGFFVDYSLTTNFKLQPEFQYSNQGNKDKDLRINYLQMPVIFKYNITELIDIQLGPQVGLKIWEWEDHLSNKPNFSTFNFALIGGIGLNITDNILINIRYAFGVLNVFDKDGFPTEIDGTSQNIQLSLGYRL